MGVHVCLQAVPGSEATDTPCRAGEDALSHPLGSDRSEILLMLIPP